MFERYLEYEGLLVAMQVVLVMVGMGATLSPADFIAVARRPRSLIIGFACQFLLAPLVTLVLLRIYPLDPGISVGLLLIAAMPGGPLANLFTHLARGDVAFSVVLTGFGTLASIISVPVILGLYASQYLPEGFSMPVDAVVKDVIAYLVIPLAAGMLFGRLAPRIATRISPWLIRIGTAALITIVAGSLASGRIDPLSYGWGTPIAIVILCVVIQNICIVLFAVLRWPVAEQTAVGIGVTIRNINLAFLLLARLFPGKAAADGPDIQGGVLYVILFWGALSLVVCTPSIYFQRRALLAEQSRI